MWSKIAGTILRNRIAILIVFGALTAFMAFMSQNVNYQYGLPELLPYDDSTLVEYREFRAQYGKEPTVIVLGIEKNPIQEIGLFNSWYNLSEKLKQVEGVDTVVSVASVYQLNRLDSPKKFLVQPLITQRINTQEELDAIRAQIDALPFYSNLLYNPETEATLMAISLNDKIFNSTERQVLISSIMNLATEFG